VSYVEWDDRASVGAQVKGGIAALSLLDVRPSRAGTPVTIDDLTFDLPVAATDSGGSDDGARAWKWFDLGPGRRLDVAGAGDYSPDGESDAWIAVPGFDNYRLPVMGASAAAEIGTDESGRYLVRIDLDVTTSDGGSRPYHLEWDSTPERALAELRGVTASFRVDISCAAPAASRACAQTRRALV
jgi:hypothetical protein